MHFILIRPATKLTAVTYRTARALTMPFGCLYLVHFLNQSNIETTFLDDISLNNIDTVLDSIKDSTTAIGISSMSGTQLTNAIEVAKELKAKTELPLIWGGVHATHLPDQTCQDPLVDYCFIGEGEVRLPMLVKAIDNKDFDGAASIPGVFTKNGPNIPLEKSALYTPLSDVIDLPYNILDMNLYTRSLLVGPKREALAWTSRGCPHRCRFCSNPSKTWPNTTVRLHSIDHVVHDVQKLTQEYGVDCIHFSDENFVMSEKRLIKIFTQLREKGVTCKYRFAGRIDSLLKLSDSTYNFLKDCGVISIASAPESGSQHVLELMGKGVTSEKIYLLDEILTKHRFNKTYNTLFGVPGETIEDINDTVRMVVKIAQKSTYCPYPFSSPAIYIPLAGTGLYEDAIKVGFQPPQTMRQWGEFDLQDMESTLEKTRPWIKGNYKKHLLHARNEIIKLNESMIGEDIDMDFFEGQLETLRKIADTN